ncbi:MAG TPA: hypothetical protein VHX88_20985 [Solirubrobacteraceae bacterium]|jgi:hypothetical protein|nr:hypothetical protein [Solirubrobacteraceae bacterium]
MVLWVPYKPGPARGAEGPLHVSVTEFTPAHRLDLPRILLAGLLLRAGWRRRPGAVGLWLWFTPTARRLGSVSIWQGEADLRGFVRLPVHVAIMRRYRTRGSVRATSWTADRLKDIRGRAAGWLA